jgi:ABC-type Mn2+/Zn2+ transport system permease subunit
MAGAVVITALANTAGLALSYQYDIPTGPFIVFLAVVFYALSFLLRRKRA